MEKDRQSYFQQADGWLENDGGNYSTDRGNGAFRLRAWYAGCIQCGFPPPLSRGHAREWHFAVL